MPRRSGASARVRSADEVRRQAPRTLRALTRPSTYLGAAREVGVIGVHLAAYPLGFVPGLQGLQLSSREAAPSPTRSAPEEVARLPIVFLHGYVHNRSAFLYLSRQLRRAGLRNLHAMNYNPLVHDIPTVAGRLAERVEEVRAASGTDRVVIIGHSLGGIVARYYAQVLGGDDRIDTCVTMGSPHRGTYSAFLGAGPAATQMRPGSWVMRELQETARPSTVRWLAFYADLDVLITPAANAKITHPALQAVNLPVANAGHLTLLLSPDVVERLLDYLTDPDLGRPEPPAADVPPARTEAEPAAAAGGAPAGDAGASITSLAEHRRARRRASRG